MRSYRYKRDPYHEPKISFNEVYLQFKRGKTGEFICEVSEAGVKVAVYTAASPFELDKSIMLNHGDKMLKKGFYNEAMASIKSKQTQYNRREIC